MRKSTVGTAAQSRVVVTRFECYTLLNFVIITLLHLWLKRFVRRAVGGLLGVAQLTNLQHRTVWSVSLWDDLGSIYSMGNCPPHIRAARLPHRLGIKTTCGVFTLTGDWRQVMFGSQVVTHSPLSRDVDSTPVQSRQTRVRRYP